MHVCRRMRCALFPKAHSRFPVLPLKPIRMSGNTFTEGQMLEFGLKIPHKRLEMCPTNNCLHWVILNNYSPLISPSLISHYVR